MGRLEGWEKRLAAEVREWRNRGFVWGRADCMHFCIACERALTGRSVFDDFPGYDSRPAGARAMIARGYSKISDLISSRMDVVPASVLRRGDWCQVEDDRAEVFGVCVGRHAAVMDRNGLQFVPLSLIRRGWVVG